MLIRQKVYFNQKLAHPYYSSWNSPNIITLSYSVEHLARIIFCESVPEGVIPRTLTIFAHFGQKSNLKSRWSLSKEKRHEAYRKCHVASNFAVSMKTQLYGYFYGNSKNPATLLTILVLALLLSTIGGIVIHDPRKR